MISLGLIGYPLDHSLSPKIHKAAMRACGLAGNYSLLPIPAHERLGLEKALARLRSGEISGLNITIPHKIDILPLLDGLTPIARAIGAVNTVFCRDQKLIGDNTDAPAFLADLQRSFDFKVTRSLSALIIGAGGAARAVTYALSQEGWEIKVLSRRSEAARELAEQVRNSQALNAFPTPDQLMDISLVVNATPLGMEHEIENSPWPHGRSFPRGATIYDLVYVPRSTRLLREARSQGLRAVNGLGMLVEQAALAFEIWTGQHVSREILFDSVRED